LIFLISIDEPRAEKRERRLDDDWRRVSAAVRSEDPRDLPLVHPTIDPSCALNVFDDLLWRSKDWSSAESHRIA
jgi:hypothetical protein